MLAIGRQTKSGVNMPELQHISLILGILIIGGFLMMMQGIKVHGRRHGWFR